MRRFVLRREVLTLLGLLAVLSMVGLSTAWAASSTADQFSSLPVTTTMNVHTGSAGQMLTISATTVNKSTVTMTAYVGLELVYPNGTYKYFSASPSLAAGQSYTLRKTFSLTKGKFPAGSYTTYGTAEFNTPCQRSESSVTQTLP
jgi:hypothetical protein